jgi:single-stranded-DNA-specific exonuclease
MGDAPLFTRFGGHAHAVGFSLPTGRLPLLRERMRAQSSAALTSEMLVPRIECDLELKPSDLTMDLIRWLGRCAPFGMGNREPVFATRGLQLSAAPRIIKEKHLSLPLAKSADGRSLHAMGWSRSGQVSWADRCIQLHLAAGSRIDLVYRLRENQHPTYGGIELELIDLAAGKN